MQTGIFSSFIDLDIANITVNTANMKFSLPVIGLMAVTVLAQEPVEQPIVDAIAVIQSRTQQVDADVLAWSGSRRGFIPIFFDSQKLLKSINNGTTVANANEPLDFNGAVNVGLATLNLIPIVNQTLIDYIAAIPKFNKLYLTPTVLDSLNLRLQLLHRDYPPGKSVMPDK